MATPTDGALTAAGSSTAAAGGTEPVSVAVVNHGRVSTASNRRGATVTGRTTCTGHGAASVAATHVLGAWVVGTAASTASMALVVVALAGAGTGSAVAGSVASAAGSGGRRTVMSRRSTH